ncbi:esterase-like activity of phytase family protein [Rhodoplanes sp. Z2-YC6860]|uniref:esterase-like activity of phytase family protein n=1 Tax=Rhodoplanes sp. Z2-YC6860 TaxID=674703 RepID=UPI00082EB78B|nr:esterase-like activity of phytase family protein [Rhodoplanes sp. Z2-YC6860]
MKTVVSRIAAFLAILALALIPAAAQPPHESGPHRIDIKAQAIDAFDARNPKQTRFGALDFRGGLLLESPARDFGGISAIRVAADGQNFLALTDKSNWLRGQIVYRGIAPIAIRDAEMAPMLGPDRLPLKRRGWYDTESLAEDGGTVYVGIERVQRIVRFDYGRDGLTARGIPIPVLPAFKTLPKNGSLECLVMPPHGGPLAGTLIAISEQGLDARGNRLSFLIGGGNDGTFALKNTDDDFDISDCALTPNGKMLVLERRFSWTSGFAMRIRSVPLASIKPGATVDGPVLITADMGSQIDNMEGLSVHRAADGTLVLTLISDDNFFALQRTVLLQFGLVGE